MSKGNMFQNLKWTPETPILPNCVCTMYFAIQAHL
jgi:hypothetical protein